MYPEVVIDWLVSNTDLICHLVSIKLNKYKLCCRAHCTVQMIFLIFILLAKKKKETHPAYHYTHEEGTPTRFWQECVYLQLQKEI